MRSGVVDFTGFDELEDPFKLWCRDNGIGEQDEPAAFSRYVLETSGFYWDKPLDFLEE